MTSIGRPHYAVFAGIFGSAGSLFGKFISHSDSLFEHTGTETELNQQVVIATTISKSIFEIHKIN